MKKPLQKRINNFDIISLFFDSRFSFAYFKSGIIHEMSDEVIVPNWLYKLHTSLLFFGWGYLADIGILTIRYLKGWKYYILLH